MRSRKLSHLLILALLAACQSNSANNWWPTPPDQANNTCDCNQSWCYASCCIDHCVSTLASIDQAKTSIRVASTSPLAPDMAASLQKARTRGVDVRIITAKAETTAALRQNGLQAKTLPTMPQTALLLVDDINQTAPTRVASLQSVSTPSGNKMYSLKGIEPNYTALDQLIALTDWEDLWQQARE